MNAPLVISPFPVIWFGWVCCCTHPQWMTGNGQLTRGVFMVNDCLRNPHFRCLFVTIADFGPANVIFGKSIRGSLFYYCRIYQNKGFCIMWTNLIKIFLLPWSRSYQNYCFSVQNSLSLRIALLKKQITLLTLRHTLVAFINRQKYCLNIFLFRNKKW